MTRRWSLGSRSWRRSDGLDNLALACIDCNLSKGVDLTGIDPESGELTELFHPGFHVWSEQRRGAYIIGKTAIGRTTAQVLNFNSEDQVALKQIESH